MGLVLHKLHITENPDVILFIYIRYFCKLYDLITYNT